MRENPRQPLRRHATRTATAGLIGVLALSLGACGEQDEHLRTPDGEIITTVTSRVAQADVLNPDRDFAKTCLAATVADPGRADVSRIVVTDPALLDALCALGLQETVTAVTAGAGSVPAYLGPELAQVPTIGTEPSADAVREANAQLVLTTAGSEERLAALRATGALGDAEIETVPVGGDWRASFTAVAEAVGRSRAASERLEEFDTEAARVGRIKDAAHSQVSLVRFTADHEWIEGTGGFAAGIVSQVGAQRPAAQRGAEAVEISAENFTAADGDQIYVGAEGPKALERAKRVLESDAWAALGAAGWNKVLWIDDEVWFRSSGLAAAWLVLNDLKDSLF